MNIEDTEVAQRGTEKGKGWEGRTADLLGRKVRAVEVSGVLRGPSAALRMTSVARFRFSFAYQIGGDGASNHFDENH
jgi:hypothetical protein